MSDFVLDASLALQWFLEDEENRKYSLAVLASLSEKRAQGLAEMFNVHRRLVRDALDNPLPPKRKIPLRQHTSLASAIPLIDVLLLADRDVPYSQKHSAPSIHHQIQCELAGLRVAGSTVRGYVRKRKIEVGLGSQRVDLAAERTVVFEWMRAVQQGAIPRAEMKKALSHVLEFDKLLRGTREVLLHSARRQ